MIILPAIDIKGGKCIRLFKGDFSKTTEYNKSPTDQAAEFTKFGFKNIHVIDLDGALEGTLVNKSIIKDIIKNTDVKIQVGGGIRSLENIKEWFQAFSQAAGITLHVENIYGDNSHHIIESCFKGLARSLRFALEIDPKNKKTIPSTKGSL